MKREDLEAQQHRRHRMLPTSGSGGVVPPPWKPSAEEVDRQYQKWLKETGHTENCESILISS